jgi:glycerol-3-phosphate dehydrogenase
MSDRKPLTVRRATVFGGGAFGTSLSLLLVRNQASDVRIWHPSKKECDEFNSTRRNDKFLKGVTLPKALTYTVDVSKALFMDDGSKSSSKDDAVEVIIFAIPTQFFRGFLEKNKDAMTRALKHCKIAFMACKGIENKTLLLPTKILDDVLGKEAAAGRMAVIAGPSFAIEVAEGKLTAVTIAAADIDLARYGQQLLTTEDGTFRCFASAPDMITCEVASSMKNVVAIASGAADGLGLGRNARALIITRGLVEIVQLAQALAHGEAQKRQSLPAVLSLAGVGDVVLTCTSSKSRNFTVGQRVGKGETMDEIRNSMTAVAEGVATAESLTALARKLGCRLHLCEAVNDVLQGKTSVKEAMDRLVDPRKTPLTDEPLIHAKL